MLKANDIILVPWDFTPSAENSLYHAVQLAKVSGNTITLLHVVEKSGFLASKAKAKVEIEIRGTKSPAQIVKTPFYKRPY